jgi:hypothetical protein
VDVKTLLLLGAGMIVLALVAFCSEQSRSASLADDGMEAPMASQRPAGSVSGHQIDTRRFSMKGKIPAAPPGVYR